MVTISQLLRVFIVFLLTNISNRMYIQQDEIRTILSPDISQLVKFAGSDNSQFVDLQGRTFLSYLFCRDMTSIEQFITFNNAPHATCKKL